MIVFSDYAHNSQSIYGLITVPLTQSMSSILHSEGRGGTTRPCATSLQPRALLLQHFGSFLVLMLNGQVHWCLAILRSHKHR